jgi:uncharacterized Zn finger protein
MVFGLECNKCSNQQFIVKIDPEKKEALLICGKCGWKVLYEALIGRRNKHVVVQKKDTGTDSTRTTEQNAQ